MSANGMRQVEERHVASKIELMVWCNRMDLLALSNCRGEVQLHRLNWQKVWNLPPPSESSTVRAMIWKPDGKVLAVGYSCGATLLVDVENKEILHSTKSGDAESSHAFNCGGVTCLSWGFKSENPNSNTAYKINEDSAIFLPNPPVLNPNYTKKGDEGMLDMKQGTKQSQFNILLIGYENGELHMSVFGLFPCGVIDLKRILNVTEPVRIINAQLSDGFASLQVFAENTADNSLKLVLLDTEVLTAYSNELHALATKHGQMVKLMTYIDQTMLSIVEAWEQILLEMDSKLEKYAAQVPEGGISADFLDLLMLGTPSTELKLFLLRDLTTKGLKKFGSSVELSYSTIQKLVLKQLNTVGHDITYHLSELRGLARIIHRYEILGLEEEMVTKAILSSSAFVNKCLELQQVIDHGMKNYKAFFRWLYTVIVRLSDEHMPAEIVKITQQDLTYIAEFLLNFDKVGICNTDGTPGASEKKGRFNLERLGQYLADKELTMPLDDENPWTKFLNENKCIAEHPAIVKTFRNFSLVQQKNHLKNTINVVFNCSRSLAEQFSLMNIVNCIDYDIRESSLTSGLRVSQINVEDDQSILIAFTDTKAQERGFFFMEISYRNDEIIAKCVNYYFNNDTSDANRLNVLDLQFYSQDVLSILLEHENDDFASSFVQFPVRHAKVSAKLITLENLMMASDVPKLNAFATLEAGACKVLDKISGQQIAVSGGRKVAAVLSKTCRKVRLFEMEVDGEEDDDETLDTTPQSHSTTQHSDTSQQNVSMNDSAGTPMRIGDENQAETMENTSENF